MLLFCTLAGYGKNPKSQEKSRSEAAFLQQIFTGKASKKSEVVANAQGEQIVIQGFYASCVFVVGGLDTRVKRRAFRH
jgi:hypothetical protein